MNKTAIFKNISPVIGTLTKTLLVIVTGLALLEAGSAKSDTNNNSSTPQNAVEIPEPTSIVGLFALGTLGAGSALKRSLKRQSKQQKPGV